MKITFFNFECLFKEIMLEIQKVRLNNKLGSNLGQIKRLS